MHRAMPQYDTFAERNRIQAAAAGHFATPVPSSDLQSGKGSRAARANAGTVMPYMLVSLVHTIVMTPSAPNEIVHWKIGYNRNCSERRCYGNAHCTECKILAVMRRTASRELIYVVEDAFGG